MTYHLLTVAARYTTYPCFPIAFSIFPHVSRKVTVRLKTSLSGVESLSTQKYPTRSNWRFIEGQRSGRLPALQQSSLSLAKLRRPAFPICGLFVESHTCQLGLYFLASTML